MYIKIFISVCIDRIHRYVHVYNIIIIIITIYNNNNNHDDKQ